VAKYVGAKRGIAFGSGRAAFSALLEALEYPAGATILMPLLNYPVVPRTVAAAGLCVRWVDVKLPGFTPRFEKIENSCLDKAVALVWLHLLAGLVRWTGSRISAMRTIWT
jgi:dTDP-4-amino-4,6-dideoxygalactose transaminase